MTGYTVTIGLASGTLNGPTTATTNASGLATFSGLSITTPGTYTLNASATGYAATSSSFIISAAGLNALSFTTGPSNFQAGNTMNAIVVKATDSFGNAVSGSSVTLNSSGTLSGTLTAMTNASGLATFSRSVR